MSGHGLEAQREDAALESAGWTSWPPDDDGREHTVVGTVKRLADFESPQLGNRRDLFVYLPPSLGAASDRRYPVLYMQDGQNIFDDALSFAGEWAVDQTLEAAAPEGLEAIVVAVPNMGTARMDEYLPFHDAKLGGGRGHDYVAFLADTVKTRVDADFPTLPDQQSTGVMGSSMGGLISLYAFFDRPDAFGFVGAMSPALWPSGHRALHELDERPNVGGRMYVDVGTREGWGELRDVRRLRKLLERKGYSREENLLYIRERGGHHREAAWRRRFRRAVEYFLRPDSVRSSPRARRR